MDVKWLLLAVILVIFSYVVLECSALPLPVGIKSGRSSSAYLTQDEYWFSQRLDHYSPTDHRHFNQRYYEFLDYFQAHDGPIFLKVCGEYSCDGIANDYMALKNDGDFLYLLADAAVTAFQYGYPDVLCSPLVEASSSGKDLMVAYADYVKNYLSDGGVESYGQQFLKNTTVDADSNGVSNSRSWWYQVCTEFAYFQVAPSNDSVRSSKVDTKYHLDLCENVFGKGIYPEVDITNLYYGGTSIAGSKIIFMNGSQDPWRHASKQKSSDNMPSYIITCHNCGHGTDLRGCPQSPSRIEGDASDCASPDVVHKARQQMVEHIDLWLSQCQDEDHGGIFVV